uniref:Uncharacterized protein n=1 Tax=Setaria digitata TaxID=48799 RepID=A0A915PQN2_9BILA
MSKPEKAGAQQTSLLDVLKKKMRQAREEAEAAKDEADEVKRLLEEERKKREDVHKFDKIIRILELLNFDLIQPLNLNSSND